MKKAFRPEKQITAPVYPGGKKALDEFIRTNLRYPEEAIENKIEGTVSVDYNLDVFGKVIEAKIKHGLGYGCDEEALRLTRLLRFPKRKYQGLHVVFHMHLHIHFRLHTGSKTDKAPALQIQYNIVQGKEDKPGYGYSVTL